jgi:hypothetical protein
LALAGEFLNRDQLLLYLRQLTAKRALHRQYRLALGREGIENLAGSTLQPVELVE